MSDQDDELLRKIKSGEKITKDDINNNNEGVVNLSEGTNAYYYGLNEKNSDKDKNDN